MRCSNLVLLAVVAVTANACVAHDTGRSTQIARNAPAPTHVVAPAPAPTQVATSAPDTRAWRRAAEKAERRQAEITRFAASRQVHLQHCVDRARVQHPALAGKVAFDVTLAEDGYVLRADVRERSWTGGDAAAAEDCMLHQVRRWIFPGSGPLDEYEHVFSAEFPAAQAAGAAASRRESR